MSLTLYCAYYQHAYQAGRTCAERHQHVPGYAEYAAFCNRYHGTGPDAPAYADLWPLYQATFRLAFAAQRHFQESEQAA